MLEEVPKIVELTQLFLTGAAGSADNEAAIAEVIETTNRVSQTADSESGISEEHRNNCTEAATAIGNLKLDSLSARSQKPLVDLFNGMATGSTSTPDFLDMAVTAITNAATIAKKTGKRPDSFTAGAPTEGGRSSGRPATPIDKAIQLLTDQVGGGQSQ